MLRVTVTCSETDEKNTTFKVVTKVRNLGYFIDIFFWGGDKVGVLNRDFNNSSSIVIIIKIYIKIFS